MTLRSLLPRISSAQENRSDRWQPFANPESMMAEAEKQIAAEDWLVLLCCPAV